MDLSFKTIKELKELLKSGVVAPEQVVNFYRQQAEQHKGLGATLEVFDKESINLVYSLPINSFVLITDVNNKIYLAKINNIFTKNLSKNDIKNKEYLVKSNSKIIDEIYSSYDLSLNKKYKVKVFENTLDRIKNNFK